MRTWLGLGMDGRHAWREPSVSHGHCACHLLLGAWFLGFWSTVAVGQTSPNRALRPVRPKHRQVDQRRAALAGIRKLAGRHLTLYTDLPSRVAVDQLPAVFDAAVPQWAEYFGVPLASLADWHVQGYLMDDRELFAQLDLLPETNRQFKNGYAQGDELWWLEQPSDYYRRHLLLHEGTHAFMWTQLGGCGTPWYMEGMAELLATHRWDGRRLRLRQMPASRKEVPMWGRIKLIREAYRRRQAPSLPAVLHLGTQGQAEQLVPMTTAQYAWCWALAKLLDTDPRFQATFRKLPKVAARADFQHYFRQQFQPVWPELSLQWRSLVSTLEFGHDFARMAIRQVPARPLGRRVATASIASDRGWQSTGWLLRAGQAYRLTARGQFVVARQSDPEEVWHSEPGGITLQYHAGQPLGKLLAVLLPAAKTPRSALATGADRPGSATAAAAWLEPFAVGLEHRLTPRHDAVLYLRVNDSSARLADNEGTVVVSLRIDEGPPGK